jgi:hypothetical protein
MLRKLCELIAQFLPVDHVPRPDGTPYLDRYYIWRGGDGFALYLHHFVGDDPDELHDHPADGWSLILAGRYYEERANFIDNLPVFDERTRTMTTMRWVYRTHHVYKPGNINVVREYDFHRITLRGGDAWTIWFRKPRRYDWGFGWAEDRRVVMEAPKNPPTWRTLWTQWTRPEKVAA